MTRGAACRLYAGTQDGLVTLQYTGSGVERVAHALDGEAVRAIAVDPDDPDRVHVGCGNGGYGLHRSDDAGRSTTTVGFTDEWVWDVTFAPDATYVGTEPPMLYVSRDGGEFEAFDAIDDLPSRPDWLFYHEPFHAGHVHGVSVHPDRPEQVFAGVEVGAAIYTRDGGRTWHETLVDADVHRVATDPDNPDRVLVGHSEGVHESRNAGRSWTDVGALRGKYVHALRFDPHDDDRVWVYASTTAEPHLEPTVDLPTSPLYRSDDRGNTWRAVGTDLPSAHSSDNVGLHPGEPGVAFYAGNRDDGGSRLFVTADAGDRWRRTDVTLPKTWRVTAGPAP